MGGPDYEMLIREVGSIIDSKKLNTSDNILDLPSFGNAVVKNETFNEPGIVIDSPSNEYLVHPAVVMSQRRS